MLARGLTRARATWLAAALAVAALTPAAAAADDIVDRIDRLTGVDTPESENLDKAADAAVAEAAKLKDEADEASREAAAEIDPETVKKALETGDLSALMVDTPEAQHARDLVSQSEQRMNDAYEQAQAAADARAKAAAEQRCVASAGAAAPAGSGRNSPYLCAAVLAAEADAEPNDPWEVCACARQYLEGVSREIETIRQEAASFVGQLLPRGYDPANPDWQPLTEEETAQYVPAGAPIDTQSFATGVDIPSFRGLAQEAQRTIAKARIWNAVAGHQTVPFTDSFGQTYASLQPAKRNAYYLVQQAARQLWSTAQDEAVLAMVVAFETYEHWRAGADRSFIEKRDAIEAALEAARESNPYDLDVQPYIDQTIELCRQSNEAELPNVDAGVNAARRVAADLYRLRARLIADMEAWRTFGLNDGAGTTVEAGIWNYMDEDFSIFIVQELQLSHYVNIGLAIPFQMQEVDKGLTINFETTHVLPTLAWNTPECTPWAYYMPDPAAGYPYASETIDTAANDAYQQRILEALQARYPETERAGSAIWLRFALDREGQVASQTVSGAGEGEGP